MLDKNIVIDIKDIIMFVLIHCSFEISAEIK